MHVTLMTALAFCLLAPTAAPQDPASLLPADTMLYTGTDSLRAGSQAAKHSAMHLIFNEPEVKAFLNKPLAMLDRVLLQAAKDSGFEESPVTMSDIVLGSADGPPIGRLFIALTHFDLNMGDGGMPRPDVGLVVGVEMLSADDLGMIRGLWNMLPSLQEETTHNGHTLFSKTGPADTMSAHLVFLDTLAVMSLSRASIEGVIDRFAGGGASLASTPEYERLLSIAGGHHAGGSTTFMRPGGFVNLARQALTMALQSESKGDMVPMVTAILDSIGLDSMHALGAMSFRDADGLVHATDVVFRDMSATGLIADMMGDLEPLSLAHVDKLPGNAMGASASRVPNLGVLYDFTMAIIDQIEPSASAEVRAGIERVMPESDLRRMILDNIGGELWSFTLPDQGIMSMPASVYRVEAKDPRLFIEGMQKIAEFASAESGMDISLTADENEAEGVVSWSLDLSKTPAAMMVPGMTPGFGIDGNDLLFSMESVELLRQSVTGDAGEGQLSDIDEFADFFDDLKGKGEVVNFMFTDNAATFKAIYGQVAGMAQMFGGGMKDLPIDLALLPTEGAISQHLRYSMLGGYSNTDGSELVTHSVSQFEMSDFTPLLVMGAAFYGISETGMYSDVLTMEEEADPSKQVMDDLGRIKAGLTIYKIMDPARQYPDSLEAIIEPLEEYPNGYMGSLELPVDPWGNGYRYALNGKKPKLWSVGPDGIDEQGGGDDIVKSK